MKAYQITSNGEFFNFPEKRFQPNFSPDCFTTNKRASWWRSYINGGAKNARWANYRGRKCEKIEINLSFN